MGTERMLSAEAYPVFPHLLPAQDRVEGRYRVTFARTRDELEAVQRLRFEVFNVELNEGLAESFETGLDRDPFDEVCHHLMVIDAGTGAVVGTYRMQTGEMAAAHRGFYSAEEYDFAGLPADVLADAVEVGRACVHADHRNRMVLFLLWKGLASYMESTRKRYLFGCCSLTSQDPVEALQVMEHLRREDRVRDDIRLPARPGWVCYGPGFALTAEQAAAPVTLPRLFRTYLRYGAKVCSEPALDRSFKTVDYLVLFDLDELDPHSRKMFFG